MRADALLTNVYQSDYAWMEMKQRILIYRWSDREL